MIIRRILHLRNVAYDDVIVLVDAAYEREMRRKYARLFTCPWPINVWGYGQVTPQGAPTK